MAQMGGTRVALAWSGLWATSAAWLAAGSRRCGLCRSGAITTKQQIAGAIHQLHRLVLTAAVGVMLSGAALPGLVHLCSRQPPGAGQLQALAGDDRLQVWMLAQGPPVALAQAATALTPSRPPAGGRSATAAETATTITGTGGGLIGTAGEGEEMGPLKGGLGHGGSGTQPACCSADQPP